MSSFSRVHTALWLPWALYAYPAVAGVLGRSEVPEFLGRYSLAFLVLNVCNLLLLASLAVALRRRSHVAITLGYLLIAFTSLLLPANNFVAALPAMRVVLPLIRLGSFIAVGVAAFERRRTNGRETAPALLGFVMLGAFVSVLDVALLVFLSIGQSEPRPDSGLRRTYDLAGITQADDVIVGDSFVWGQGVSESERFGDRLQAIYEAEGVKSRVYSLGLIGVGLEQYLSLLSSIPTEVRARNIVVAFYMNDMPPVASLGEKLYGVVASLGRGSSTLRLVGDRLARFWLRDVDAYHEKVVQSYERSESSYGVRWRILVERLSAIRQAASRHTTNDPKLLILPLMVDFETYPLEDSHADLAREADRLGFETLDMLPVFRREIANPIERRAAPGENHYDALTHELIARSLHEVLTSEGKRRDVNRPESGVGRRVLHGRHASRSRASIEGGEP